MSGTPTVGVVVEVFEYPQTGNAAHRRTRKFLGYAIVTSGSHYGSNGGVSNFWYWSYVDPHTGEVTKKTQTGYNNGSPYLLKPTKIKVRQIARLSGIVEAPNMSRQERDEVLAHANTIESELMRIANGTLKVGKLSLESIARLVAYAKTGKIKPAILKAAGEERPYDLPKIPKGKGRPPKPDPADWQPKRSHVLHRPDPHVMRSQNVKLEKLMDYVLNSPTYDVELYGIKQNGARGAATHYAHIGPFKVRIDAKLNRSLTRTVNQEVRRLKFREYLNGSVLDDGGIQEADVEIESDYIPSAALKAKTATRKRAVPQRQIMSGL